MPVTSSSSPTVAAGNEDGPSPARAPRRRCPRGWPSGARRAFGQPLGFGLADDQRREDRPAAGAQDVGDHPRQLHAGLLQRPSGFPTGCRGPLDVWSGIAAACTRSGFAGAKTCQLTVRFPDRLPGTAGWVGRHQRRQTRVDPRRRQPTLGRLPEGEAPGPLAGVHRPDGNCPPRDIRPDGHQPDRGDRDPAPACPRRRGPPTSRWMPSTASAWTGNPSCERTGRPRRERRATSSTTRSRDTHLAGEAQTVCQAPFARPRQLLGLPPVASEKSRRTPTRRWSKRVAATIESVEAPETVR